ncbi:MmgE/PrpD family protein [Streptomyces sp. NPDC050625]|uniref:MmgE/PrpD family protein n=1 Tax=Streptomyces sp. NPDC050625 TaxID=3154629 RepID=UPI003442088A
MIETELAAPDAASRAVTRDLAAFAVNVDATSIPGDRLELLHLAVLDTVGVAVAASREKSGRIVSQYAQAFGPGSGATVFGCPRGARVPAEFAALANGTMAHALDFDDMHTRLAGHPSAVLVPAVLALAEEVGSSGDDVLTAMAVAYEVVHRVAALMGYPALFAGFHPTGVWAPVGTAAAAARLLGLSIDQACMALGIAASQAGGLRANFGSMVKPFHAGHGGMAGIMAAKLAALGFVAGDDAIGGPNGFVHCYGGDRERIAEVVEGLGTRWFPLEGYSVKLYPACGKTHATVDAALALRGECSVEAIDRITIDADESVADVLPYSRPATGLQAKFSLEYAAVVALLDGKAGLAQYTDERLADPRLQDLLMKTESRLSPGNTEEQFFVNETVTLHLQDGRQLTNQVAREAGDLGQEVPREDVVRKFRDCCEGTLSDAAVDAFLAGWETLATMPDVSAWMRGLQGAGADSSDSPDACPHVRSDAL